MDSSFGARLKAQRESQQVSLELVSAQTKIRVALLEGLERDDVSHWPAGIYRRSYLRSYAAAIGLDPEPAVREFVALYPDGLDEPQPLAEPELMARRPPMRLQYLIASAFGAFSPKDRKASPPNSILTPPQTPETVGLALPTAETIESVNTTDAASAPADEERLGGIDEEFEFASANDTVEADVPVQFDLAAMAQLCTRLVEAKNATDLEPLLEEASRILHAIGIIVWPWDANRGVLWPSLSAGYPRKMLSKLPTLARDADNPIGAAFRASACQVVGAGGSSTSAIAVPLMTSRGCTGVLAIECASGLEQDASLQSLATILAAQLSTAVNAEPIARTAIA